MRFNKHPKRDGRVKNRLRSLAIKRLTGSTADGVLHRAVLGRPRI